MSAALAHRETVDVDHPRDPAGPRVGRGVGDRAAAGVPDEHDLAAGRVDGVDHLDHGVDVVAQGDLRSVGVLRLHAGQRQRLHAVPGLPRGRGSTSSQDEPSSQKPGIRMMSIARG